MGLLVRWLYTLLFLILLPIILTRLWWRGRKASGYREGIIERFGYVPKPPARPLWVHAVSLGESIAITPLIERWMSEHPDIPVHVTNMTPTGRDHIRKHFGSRVSQSYCPYDLPILLRFFLNRLKPIACLVVETELWPNMVHTCFKRDVPLVVANARLSARSAKGYRKFKCLSLPMLSKITTVVAQSSADAERFVSLGVPEPRVFVSGSIKFDIHVDPSKTELGQSLRSTWLGANKDAYVVMLASSHADEEAQFLDAFMPLLDQHPSLHLMVVPRHPERFEPVWQLLVDRNLSVSRRSALQGGRVLLGDSLGEMMAYYAMCDAVVMGGSFVDVGGHNPIEPAALSKPVIMGPFHHNFLVITQAMVERKAMHLAASMHSASALIEDVCAGRQSLMPLGQKARAYAAEQQGALNRLLNIIERTVADKTPD